MSGLTTGLIGVRAAIGGGAYAAPSLTGKLFGLDVDGNPQAPYLARLFGARDVALAVGTSSSSGEARARWLKIGIACDLADAVAGIVSGRNGELPTATAIMVTATALTAAALGVAVLQSESSS